MNPTHWRNIFQTVIEFLRLCAGRVCCPPCWLAFIVLLCGDVFANELELPVASWDFETETSLVNTYHGNVHQAQPGPRPPQFPSFSPANQSIRLDGKGARVVVKDNGEKNPFDFEGGDALSLVAWVRVEGKPNSSPMYVIGKGRTGSDQFAADNQNWALRVVGDQRNVRLSFLFATRRTSGEAHWHRWTSEGGFDARTGWHQIAVTYRFGEPASARGWIDGNPTTGKWDMGGATTEPPIVDDDDVWIGSSSGGRSSNSFRGYLDSIAIYRTLLNDTFFQDNFQRVGEPRVLGAAPEVMPQLSDVPDGRALITVSEGIPAHDRWLNEGESWPSETKRWLGDEFLLTRIPLHYDDWGIRDSWQAPLLVRMAADVSLRPGKQQFLLRARGLSRLWVDGQIVARTEAITTKPPDGEEPITPLVAPLMPGLRVPGYHQQEVLGESTIEGDAQAGSIACRVVLEMIVGGPDSRTETGECCVAVRTPDASSFEVLQPLIVEAGSRPRLLLEDKFVEPALRRIDKSIALLDDQTRRNAAATQDAFWERRHLTAKQWAAEHPVPAPPRSTIGLGHPIDQFLRAKLDRARVETAAGDSAAAIHFHETILPILQENCFRCHGEKEKGGLLLNARDRALQGGDSEYPAIVPGAPEASELIQRIESKDESLRMPPTKEQLDPEQVSLLRTWIKSGAFWPAQPVSTAKLEMAPVVGDEVFLRRIYLDTVGVPPTAEDVVAFMADHESAKRRRVVDKLLADSRYADHWVGYWLDVLAENPSLINAALNSTGPFRWFLYDALRDNKPMDRFVTELVLMRGSAAEGGSAGFAIAAENDAPLAAKGHIIASAFLGVELQCARCHDSPYHSTTQRDLYSLAAMLHRKPVTVPKTSRIPAAFFAERKREPLIRVSLGLEEKVDPTWPFARITRVTDGKDIDELIRNSHDTRERLAALITSHRNDRFARVIVNRIWKQLIGAGLVEPVHDWEGQQASHPALLTWLAREFVTHNYDAKHIIRLIVTSKLYQREARGTNLQATSAHRFFTAPERRRLSAEQIVDSLHSVTGSKIDVEELTFVHDGRRPLGKRQTLGRPHRAWMFATLNNERDRPSLTLPRARAVADVLEVFGWTGDRQKPIHHREQDANVLQPGVLANGSLTATLTLAAQGSVIAQLAIDANSPADLVDVLFLRCLGRRPKTNERRAFTEVLAPGFETRMLPSDEIVVPTEPPELPLVTWFNHLQSEANTIQLEWERRVRQGPPPDPRLRPAWREVYEDIIWSLVNHREFAWMP